MLRWLTAAAVPLILALPMLHAQAPGKVLKTVEGKLTTADEKDKVLPGRYRKVHQVKLEKGKAYQIDLAGQGGLDPFLRVEDPSGKQIAANDDDPNRRTLDSRVIIAPRKTGMYRIIATTFKPGATGNYVLTIREASKAAAALSKLQEEFTQMRTKALAGLQKEFLAAKTQEEKNKVVQRARAMISSVSAKFAPKLVRFAEEYKGTPEGQQAVLVLLRSLNYPEAIQSAYEEAYRQKKKDAAKIRDKGVAQLRKLAKIAPKYKSLIEDEIYKITKLSVGCVAPDIVGEDIDGVKFKLSDYRGKVVVLDFWGDW